MPQAVRHPRLFGAPGGGLSGAKHPHGVAQRPQPCGGGEETALLRAQLPGGDVGRALVGDAAEMHQLVNGREGHQRSRQSHIHHGFAGQRHEHPRRPDGAHPLGVAGRLYGAAGKPRHRGRLPEDDFRGGKGGQPGGERVDQFAAQLFQPGNVRAGRRIRGSSEAHRRPEQRAAKAQQQKPGQRAPQPAAQQPMISVKQPLGDGRDETCQRARGGGNGQRFQGGKGQARGEPVQRPHRGQGDAVPPAPGKGGAPRAEGQGQSRRQPRRKSRNEASASVHGGLPLFRGMACVALTSLSHSRTAKSKGNIRQEILCGWEMPRETKQGSPLRRSRKRAPRGGAAVSRG